MSYFGAASHVDLELGPAADHEAWTEFLRARIIPDWRPGEYDHQGQLFVPDPSNPHTFIHLCEKSACGVLLSRGPLCVHCKKSWANARSAGVPYDGWSAEPKVRINGSWGCGVPGCRRTHYTNRLCRSHERQYRRVTSVRGPIEGGRETWAISGSPGPLPEVERCLVPICENDRQASNGLCGTHARAYKDGGFDRSAQAMERWIATNFEPVLDGDPPRTYASAAVVPFALLPEPLSWEFLYAAQQRDQAGRSLIYPIEMRSAYRRLQAFGYRTAVGMVDFGLTGSNSNVRGMIREWQGHIDDAYREWTGVDERDSRILFFRDLELRHSTSSPPGPRAKIDLRGIRNAWISDTLIAWAHAAPRSRPSLRNAATTWELVDEVLTARRIPVGALGIQDMDAVVRAIRQRWTAKRDQSTRIGWIARIIQFGRQEPATAALWDMIPGRFAVNTTRHQPIGQPSRSARDGDDFRFIPQPIVDWIMDHLDLFVRRGSYRTAEARMMIFLQERCGRRTGETVRLKDDCISYDSEGGAYLEWQQGKPPWGAGKRIPIHQETHDAIRQWQEFKESAGVHSEWLFPSSGHSIADKPYLAGYLSVRVSEFVGWVAQTHPYPRSVEGAEGNLIHFNIADIDAYAFRHAFAQRLADATDENGQSTTQPDVLRDLMGHKHFNTTMAYYQVTAKRKKKAMSAIPPRRLNRLGEVVPVDRERDGFTRVAVTLGHCSEPQNVLSGGNSCAIDHACESCPFFLVDPLERDGVESKMQHLKVKLERATIIRAPAHVLDHFRGRIADCQRIIDGINGYVLTMDPTERSKVQHALEQMADIRRRATAPRSIDLRTFLSGAKV